MVNHNVRVTFAVRITDGIATGIWASSVLSTYINVLEGDDDRANERVGYAQAIQGTFLAAAAIPAGWLAITYRRDSILRVMGLVAFAAIATTSAALVLDVPYKYGLLCCGLALWGVAQANAPVLDALFADSVPTGNRSKLYTWLHMSYIVAQGLGPGVGAVMFALHGNVWRLEVLQRVMLVGMALAALPALLMLFFDDDQALGAESEGLLRAALLSPGDEEEGAEGAEEAHGSGRLRRGGGPVPYGSYDFQSQQSPGGGGDQDYRRPFLEAWSSETERDYRNQISASASPARPVFPAIAAMTAAAAAAAAAAGSSGGSSSYVPPDFVSTGGAANCRVPRTAAEPRAPDADADTDTATAGGVRPHVSSHALLLSPCTDRSGMTTPLFSSPPPPSVGVGRGDGVRGAEGRGAGIASTTAANTVNAAEAAEAIKIWWAEGQGGGALGQIPGSGERRGDLRLGEGASAAAERFHAVRQAVDGEAAAAAAAAVAAVAGPSESGAGSVVDGRRRRSAGGGGGGGVLRAGGIDSYSGSEGGGSGGYDSAASGSREPSLAAESAPSELSFNSLLGPASFKSAQSRAFSRAGSSSSFGSGRGNGNGNVNVNGVLADSGGSGAASPPVGLLPYLEEDVAAEADVSCEPDIPNLDPQSQRMAAGRQPAPLRTTEPLAAAAAAAIAVTAGPAGGSPPLPKPLHDDSLRTQQGAGKLSTPSAQTAGSQEPPTAGLEARHASIAAGNGASAAAATATAAAAAAAAASPGAAATDAVNGRCPTTGSGGGMVAGTNGGAREQQRGAPPPPPPPLVVVASAANPPPPPPVISARHRLDPRKHQFLCLNMAWIPGILALTDCTMGLASGMTIKFFPIFFKDEVALAPLYVNLMYCAIPLCLSAASFLAQRESRVLGRVQTMVMNRGIGIALLYWIATHSNRWHNQRLMVPVYIARTCIMNSIYPLQKSILMDFVPKERRAAWNSLESVTSFGWSGSAALGGWLIHQFGFRATFLITATMQCMGWCMSMLLLPIVPRKEAGLQAACRSVASAASGGGGGGKRINQPPRQPSPPPPSRRRGAAKPTASG